jgi:hypothetical protein
MKSMPLGNLVLAGLLAVGLADLLNNADPELLATETGKSWYDRMKKGGREGSQVALEVFLHENHIQTKPPRRHHQRRQREQ